MTLVGINFSPEPTGIGPYTSAACEHLARRGASLVVLTGLPHYPQWSLAAGYGHRAQHVEYAEGTQIRRLWHYIPRRQNAITRAVYEATFGFHVFLRVSRLKPNVIIAITPSLLSAAAASLRARQLGIPLILWVQDLMGSASSQSGIAGGRRIGRFIAAIESWVARRAAITVVVSEAFRTSLLERGVEPSKIRLVGNWSHVPAASLPRDVTRSRLGWQGRTVALHAGNMGLKQNLENIVDAARLSQRSGGKVHFVLMGDGSQRQFLRDYAGDLDTIHFLPPVDGHQYPDVLRAADVLLINERPTVLDMSLPSKLTSYLLSGRPVVGAVAHGGVTADTLRRSNAAVIVRAADPAALLGAVEKLSADGDLCALLGARGVEFAETNMAAGPALTALEQTVTLALELARRGARE